ncbi:putative YigZ family protein [Fusobacterium sp. PH5-7]|uniref:IMPACT family protein n=1 Tax=Fusobacterium sp. PH5-7 TaxID=2940528 RepID=UPI002474BE71|nr:YigZ family protein [Fusobacterium sp. PH5-7]MDH6456472.1 putative YigZ family protein [Fusobacterium sp. PH5-7]
MKSVERECSIEFEERKSKFIGYVKPIGSKQEAEDFIAEIREKHRDATHNCTVYKVVDNGQEYFKTDDDGEPSGTAGKPMGDIITYMDVTNLVVIATRYFGGIKLGAGGLVRNYAKTAKLAIQEAGIAEYIEKKTYMIDFPYEKISDVETIIDSLNGEYLDKGFNERVTYKIRTDIETFEALKEVKGLLIIEL